MRVCEPLLDGNEEAYVADCVRSNWISSQGSYLTRFEERFAEYVGVGHGVACSSGTTALHLILAAMGVGPGDEVVLPTFTIASCANMVAVAGATPVFADVDPRTFTIGAAQVEPLLSERTRAIMGVHIYGHPCAMGELRELAEREGLWLLEDAAEAFGAELGGVRAGSMGHAAAFSLYANKIITTGEGGMVTTDDGALAERMRELRNQGFFRPTHFWHRHLGFNYRLTNLQAAIGLAQIERADELVARRERLAARYDALLAGVPGIELPPRTAGVRNVFWMYAVRVRPDFGLGRDALMQALAADGVETKTFFVPLHLQPIYYEPRYEGCFPVAEQIGRDGMYLPSGPGLSDEELAYVAERIAAHARR